jgi:integrase
MVEDLKLARYPADRHPALTYLARLAASGRRTQRAALEAIARWASGGELSWHEFPWHLLRYQHTSAIRSWLQETYQVGSARTYLAALRGVLKEAWRLDLLETEAYLRARDLEPIQGQALARGRALSAGEQRALFNEAAHDERAIARRDAALLALLTGAGLRRSELAGLQLEDLDLDSGQVIVHRGKGRKDRITWLPPSGLPAIQDWLQVRGGEPGPLLCPVRKGGQLELRAMSSQAIRDVCRRRAQLAALSPFSPHDCRRTWVGDLLDAGADLATTQGLAGHASPSTTARYDRRPEAVRRRAASLLHVPYVPPPPS